MTSDAALLRTEQTRRERLAKWHRAFRQRRQYHRSGLDQVPDRFVLYRIIGNDLPPRHRAGQSLANLRFILDNEPELLACERRWVVNRIADAEQHQAITTLLAERRQPYLDIPFDPGEYARVDFAFDEFPNPGFFFSDDFLTLPVNRQQRALDHLYAPKNLYAMNNNGARNAALRDGRERGKWVLPWDGNCFLTARAWEEIYRRVIEAPYTKYFIVPMARCLDNEELLRSDFQPACVEEPQIIFRCDAAETFNERVRYGRRPKVELLLRLGVPGQWERWKAEPWEHWAWKRSPEAGEFEVAGWVARLYSGHKALESPGTRQFLDRGIARLEAIRGFLDHLDEQVARRSFRAQALCLWDETALAAAGKQYGCRELAPWLVKLLDSVEALLSTGAVETEGCAAPDRDAFDRVLGLACGLAVAGHVTARAQYVEHALSLSRWAICATALPLEFPEAKGSSRPGGASPLGHQSLLRSAVLPFSYDVFRMASRAGVLSSADRDLLERWARGWSAWLASDEAALALRNAPDARGTQYEVQLASAAAYADDVATVLDAIKRAKMRLALQFEPGGAPIGSDGKRRPVGAWLSNMEWWTQLAGLARRVGVEVGDFTGAKGCGLTAAFSHLAASMPGLASSPATEPSTRNRLLALATAVQATPTIDRSGVDPRADAEPFATDVPGCAGWQHHYHDALRHCLDARRPVSSRG